MLSAPQVEFYRANGFVTVESVFSAAEIEALRALTGDYVERSRAVTRNDSIFDLEPTHTPQNPRLRRLKNPHRLHETYLNAARHPQVVAALAQLIGPNIRLYNSSKVNMKLAGDGSPVQWHQDWAFYPHTNDDVLAVGIMLDDTTEENGPILVMPGSHQGPTYPHLDREGFFCGAFDPQAAGLDLGKAVPLMGPAGSVSFHHCRAIHGSTANRSQHSRRLLIFEYAAVDAWPLSGTYTHAILNAADLAEFDRWIISGEPSYEPRIVPTPIRMPFPHARRAGSVYEIQGTFEGMIGETTAKRSAAT